MTYLEDKVAEMEIKLATNDGASCNSLQEVIDKKIEVFAEQQREGYHPVRINCAKNMHCDSAFFSFGEHRFRIEITVYPTTLDLYFRSQNVFTGNATVVLLNQLEDRNHRKKTVTFNEATACGLH